MNIILTGVLATARVTATRPVSVTVNVTLTEQRYGHRNHSRMTQSDYSYYNLIN